MRPYVPPPGSIPTQPVPDLEGVRSAHLVGIGGAGMSGLARLLLAAGVRVTGSDLKDSAEVRSLTEAGARVAIGHDGVHQEGTDVIVVSTAIPQGNPEVAAAQARGAPIYTRAQLLAALMSGRRGIAVAGAHGKTTTTSMIATVLERAGADPTYVVGGDLNESGSNARSGDGEWFVAEADESDGSFLLLSPEIAVVTNIDDDHLDFFRDREDIEAAFGAFCRRAAAIVAYGDDAAVRRVAADAGVETITYGIVEDCRVRLEDVRLEAGRSACTLRIEGTAVLLELPFPGRHGLLNAAAAVAVAQRVGIDPADAAAALRGFAGVRRRFEHRGSARGADVVDDYAHHPTEIEATLDAARLLEPRRLLAVFQPHRFSRTAALGRALGESLEAADVVVVTDVYAAGEQPAPGITGKLVVEGLAERAPGKRIVYLPARADVAPFLAREMRPGDLVLTLGAGDVTMVGEDLLSDLADRDAGGSYGH